MPKFLLAALLLLTSCSLANDPSLAGSGAYNSLGQADGEWTLYEKAYNSTWGRGPYFIYAKGSFKDGQPDGKWTFWQHSGIKTAEVSFTSGLLNGRIEINHTSSKIGNFVNDKPEGLFEGYLDRTPEVYVKYIMNNDRSKSLIAGSQADANELGTYVVREALLYKRDINFVVKYPVPPGAEVLSTPTPDYFPYQSSITKTR